MSGVVYESHVTVTRDHGPWRRANLPAGEEVAFGVHGGIANHYNVDVDAERAVSATLDYIVAAAAG